MGRVSPVPRNSYRPQLLLLLPLLSQRGVEVHGQHPLSELRGAHVGEGDRLQHRELHD